MIEWLKRLRIRYHEVLRDRHRRLTARHNGWVLRLQKRLRKR